MNETPLLLDSTYFEADTTNVLNGTLGDFLVKFDNGMVKAIWEGTAASTGWWDMLLPAATALGAIFSLILAARIAYKSMALQGSIDILQLLRPLAICFILSNWWAVSNSLYGFVKPLEDTFKNGYVQLNQHNKMLRETRRVLADSLACYVLERGVVAREAVALEEELKRQKEEQERRKAEGDKTRDESAYQATAQNFPEVLYDEEIVVIEATSAQHRLIKYDGHEVIETAEASSTVEEVIVWIGECLWTVALFFVVFSKDLMMTALVIFGPIYMTFSLLEPWKTAWSEWISRFVTVSLYGACGFMAITFGLMLISFGLKGDIALLKSSFSNDWALLSYIDHVYSNHALTVGMTVISMFVGLLAIPMATVMATFLIPGDVMRAGSEFVDGMWRKVEDGGKKAVITAVGVVSSGAGAVMAAADKAEADKEGRAGAESLDDGAPSGDTSAQRSGNTDTDPSGGDGGAATQPASGENTPPPGGGKSAAKAEDRHSPAFRMIDSIITRYEDRKHRKDIFLNRFEENKILQRIAGGRSMKEVFKNDYEAMYRFMLANGITGAEIMKKAKGYKPDSKQMKQIEKDVATFCEQELQNRGISSRFVDILLTDNKEELRKEAERYADSRIAQQKAAGQKGMAYMTEDYREQMRADSSGKQPETVEEFARRSADRMAAEELSTNRFRSAEQTQAERKARVAAADQDLEAYRKAVEEGRGQEYMDAREERLLDNRRLKSFAMHGRLGIHLFDGDEKERDRFLRKYNLLDAFHRARNLEEKISSMNPDTTRYGKKDRTRGGNSHFEKVRNARQANADELYRLCGEKCRDILASRGIYLADDESACPENTYARYRSAYRDIESLEKELDSDTEINQNTNN